MDGNRTRVGARVKAVAECLDQMEQLPFRDVLSPADVEAALLSHGVDFRDRAYPPDITLFVLDKRPAVTPVPEAIGILSVWTLPMELKAGFVPLVPLAKVCAPALRPLKLVIPAPVAPMV
jgi:hypothetical protein